jgi:anti-sigma-K factor RskA
MIDERMEEQAALHVLGALPEHEAREFKQAMQADTELKEYVARLSTATGALAGAVPSMEPSPQLRAKILAQIEPPQKMISPPERKTGLLTWFPWALATGFAALCLILFAQDSQLKKQVGAQSAQINDLNLLAQSLQSVTNDLQQTVLALRETNRLANLKIAMLNSVMAGQPKAVAVSLWDKEKQNGVFVAENLKPLPADKDYQLWVLDNGTTPVDAGVFHVNEGGNVRVDFKAKLPIQLAGKFAVTQEVKGGAAAPTLKDMVLIGG